VLPTSKYRDKEYCVVTLHRDFNVDNPDVLGNILDKLNKISENIDIIFPVHPRTAKRIKEFKFADKLGSIEITTPLGYLDFIHALRDCELVITDSGGMQIETTILSKYCLNLQNISGNLTTLHFGSNILTDPDQIVENFHKYKSKTPKSKLPKELELCVDGKASHRIANILEKKLCSL